MTAKPELPDFMSFKQEIDGISTARTVLETDLERAKRAASQAAESLRQGSEQENQAFQAFTQLVAGSDQLYAAGYYLDPFENVSKKVTALERMHSAGELLVRIASDHAFSLAPVLEVRMDEHSAGYGNTTTGFHVFTGSVIEDDQIGVNVITNIDPLTGVSTTTPRDVFMTMGGVKYAGSDLRVTDIDHIAILDEVVSAQTDQRNITLLDNTQSGRKGSAGKLYASGRGEDIIQEIDVATATNVYIGRAAVEQGLGELESSCSKSRHDGVALQNVRDIVNTLLSQA